VNAYAEALAPAFWYIVPLLVLGFVLTLFLREVKLSDVAGMVAAARPWPTTGSSSRAPRRSPGGGARAGHRRPPGGAATS